MSATELDVLALILENRSNAFREVADAMPHLIWTAEPDGRLTFVNRHWVEYTGQPLSALNEFQGQSLVHPGDYATMRERWDLALRDGVPYETEYRLRSGKDGSYRWFLARATPLRDESGAIRQWLGTGTDIDAQKRANENLNFVIDAAEMLGSLEDERAICARFAELAVQRFADWCVLVLRDENDRYQLAALAHRDPERIRQVMVFAERYPVADDERFHELMLAGVPVLYPSITDEMLVESARDDAHLRLLRDLGMRAAIFAPLKDGTDVLGAILMYEAESGRSFDAGDMEVVKTLAERAASAIARAQAVSVEQRARRRLQFVGKAIETIHESLDISVTFGDLTRLITDTFADFAIALRVENDRVVRVIAVSEGDPARSQAAEALVGVRPLHTEAERAFIEYLQSNRTIVNETLAPGSIERWTWPYLARQFAGFTPRAAVTVPLHGRGRPYGAIVAYIADSRKRFGPDELEVLADIGRHASVAMENAQVLERERRVAETLQESLLPPSLPQIPDMRFDAVYRPSAAHAQVGGDWYDAFTLEDGSIVLSAGDVTGRGEHAAVVMGKVRHLLAIAPSYESDPARILDTVESVLMRRYPEIIVTAFLAIIDAGRSQIRFANAGHPPALLKRMAGVEELKADGLPLGLRREAPPASSRSVDLGGAQMLVVYTDGLVEATHDVLAGYRRLRGVVASDALLHTHSPATFIEESCLPERPDDDVAVLTLQFDHSLRWSFDAENARAAQDARGQFVRYLRRSGVPGEEAAMAELVFGELVGNVVRHSPGSIEIDLDWSGAHPVLHVIDRGRKFDALSRLPDNVLSESGRGLFIVKQLTRSLRIEHLDGYGNHAIAELPLTRTGA